MGKATSDCAPWFETVAVPILKFPIGGGSVILLGIPSDIDANGSNPALSVVKSETVLSFRRNLWGFVTLVRERRSIREVRLTARFCPGISFTAVEVDFVRSWPPDSAERVKERSMG